MSFAESTLVHVLAGSCQSVVFNLTSAGLSRCHLLAAGPGAQQQQPHQQQQPRVFTFGVGECSQLFLKRLAGESSLQDPL